MQTKIFKLSVLFIALFHTAHASSKCFLRGEILLGKDDKEKAITKNFLSPALNSKSCSIIVSKFLLNTYANSPELLKESLSDYFVNQSFDFYMSTDKEAGLFLLIPHKYKEKVKQKRQSFSKNQTLTDDEITLGFLVNHSDVMKKITLEELKTELKNDQPSKNVIPALKKMFVPNKRIPAAGEWILFLNGHGKNSPQKQSICSLSMSEYQEWLTFLHNNLAICFLLTLSCYAAGEHLIMPFTQQEMIDFGITKKLVPTNFPIMHIGTSDTSLELDNAGNFETCYFNFIEKMQSNKISLDKLYEECFFFEKSNLSLVPSFRPAHVEYFTPLNVWGENLFILTNAIVKSATWEPKLTKRKMTQNPTITIPASKKTLLIAPSIIPVPIKIENPQGVEIFSIAPGEHIHFLQEIQIADDPQSKPQQLQELLYKLFIATQKAVTNIFEKKFFIKQLQIPPISVSKEINILNNLINRLNERGKLTTQEEELRSYFCPSIHHSKILTNLNQLITNLKTLESTKLLKNIVIKLPPYNLNATIYFQTQNDFFWESAQEFQGILRYYPYSYIPVSVSTDQLPKPSLLTSSWQKDYHQIVYQIFSTIDNASACTKAFDQLWEYLDFNIVPAQNRSKLVHSINSSINERLKTELKKIGISSNEKNAQKIINKHFLTKDTWKEFIDAINSDKKITVSKYVNLRTLSGDNILHIILSNTNADKALKIIESIINRIKFNINTENFNGIAPLQIAVNKQYLEIIKLLLKNGASTTRITTRSQEIKKLFDEYEKKISTPEQHPQN